MERRLQRIGGHGSQPFFPLQIGTGLSYFMLGMAWNVPILFIGQVTTILQHVMHCAQALVTHFSDDDARARAMGRLSLSYGLGMVAGVARRQTSRRIVRGGPPPPQPPRTRSIAIHFGPLAGTPGLSLRTLFLFFC